MGDQPVPGPVEHQLHGPARQPGQLGGHPAAGQVVHDHPVLLAEGHPAGRSGRTRPPGWPRRPPAPARRSGRPRRRARGWGTPWPATNLPSGLRTARSIVRVRLRPVVPRRPRSGGARPRPPRAPDRPAGRDVHQLCDAVAAHQHRPAVRGERRVLKRGDRPRPDERPALAQPVGQPDPVLPLPGRVAGRLLEPLGRPHQGGHRVPRRPARGRPTRRTAAATGPGCGRGPGRRRPGGDRVVRSRTAVASAAWASRRAPSACPGRSRPPGALGPQPQQGDGREARGQQHQDGGHQPGHRRPPAGPLVRPLRRPGRPGRDRLAGQEPVQVVGQLRGRRVPVAPAPSPGTSGRSGPGPAGPPGRPTAGPAGRRSGPACSTAQCVRPVERPPAGQALVQDRPPGPTRRPPGRRTWRPPGPAPGPCTPACPSPPRSASGRPRPPAWPARSRPPSARRRSSNRTLPGFRSRWTIPRSWAAATPPASFRDQRRRRRPGPSGRPARSRSARVPPGRYSMARNGRPSCSPELVHPDDVRVVDRRHRLGLGQEPDQRPGRRPRPAEDHLQGDRPGSAATCRARYTTPIPPRPSSPSTLVPGDVRPVVAGVGLRDGFLAGGCGGGGEGVTRIGRPGAGRVGHGGPPLGNARPSVPDRSSRNHRSPPWSLPQRVNRVVDHPGHRAARPRPSRGT